MKLLLILYLLACLINVSAQNKWLKLNGPQGCCISGLFSCGDTIIAGSGLYKGLIFYSFDAGERWQQSNIKLNDRILSFIIADDGSFIAAASSNGLYNSFDLNTWSQIHKDGRYFIGLGKDWNGFLYAGNDIGKIYVSSDNGQTWTISLNGSGNTSNFVLYKDSVLFLGGYSKIYRLQKNISSWDITSFDTLDLNATYKVFSDTIGNIYTQMGGKIFISTNVGNTWKLQSDFGAEEMYDCIYNNRIIGAFGDETPWPGKEWGMALSDDKAITWRWDNNGMPSKFSAAICLAKSSDNTYVGTNAAGVFKSTNFGDSWFPVNNGINAANTVSINLDNEGNLWAACWSNGLYKSTDKGLTWSLKNNGFTNSYLMSVISDTTDILIASTEDGTFRSSDKGENWGLLNSSFYYYFYKDKLNRIYGLSYGAGLYRTTDQGNNWTRLDNGFINGYVFGFAIDSSNNIYTGTYGGAIYKSTDDGTSWTNVYQSSNSSSGISCIAIAPNGNVFAANIDEGILRSTDNGLNWKLVKSDNGFPTTYPVNVNKKGVVFAGGVNSKFYSSTNNGDTWVDITDNLALTEVRDIKFDKDDKIYLATDESVWTSSPDSSVSVKDNSPIIQQYSLSQNFPNPFNPTTTIKYSIKDPGFVKLEVYDILGRKVETLVNEEKVEGDYEANFNGRNLSSGVYIYRLTSGTFSQVKKMQLIK